MPYSSHSLLSQIFLLVIVFTVIVSPGESIIKLPEGAYVPAIIVFGDSIVDTGNNNNNPLTLAKANYAPYGNDFTGHKPTGRFSNGKTPADLIAEELGIKELVPAYNDEKLQPNDLLTGVCFASGGSGFDPLSSKSESAISLSQQLESFREYKEKLKGIVGEDKTKSILENSLYLVVAGSNDIANTYYGLRVRQLYNVSAYTDLMARHAYSFLKGMYESGARRVAVFSAPPIGCVPSQRTLAGGIRRECASKDNEAAILFNTKLSRKIDLLNSNLPNARMVYVDVYNSVQDIIQNPQKYGFEIYKRGCCGTGLIEVITLCNPSTPICEDVSKYMFWDSFHPTEKAYKIIVSQFLNKYSSKFF